MEDAGRVLRVMANIVKPVEILAARRVASIEGTGVERFDGDDAGPTILQSTHITRLAMTASTGKSLVAVRARSTVFVTGGVILVRGTVGQQTCLPPQVRIHIHTVGTNSKTLAAESTDESGVGLVTLRATLIGDGVDLIEHGRSALMKAAFVGTIVTDGASLRPEAFLNSRHVEFLVSGVV